MIRLDRRDLRDVARLVLFANTPYSLCRALEESGVVRRMVDACAEGELEEYYDAITARAGRTEVDVGLAYAVLVALLMRSRRHGPVDSSRLRWGRDIEDLLMKSGKATQQIVMEASTPRPTVQVRQHSESGGLVLRRGGAAGRD